MRWEISWKGEGKTTCSGEAEETGRSANLHEVFPQKSKADEECRKKKKNAYESGDEEWDLEDRWT